MKKFLIKIFGIDFLRYIKGIYLYIKSMPKFIFKPKVIKNENQVKDIKIYNLNNKNVFFGYYDLNPLKGNKLLAHTVRKNAKTSIDPVEIGYFDIEENKFNYLTSSTAWSWQQGSRLRWSNKSDNVIIYNDVDVDHYCTRFFNIETKKIEKTIPYALYDIDKNENYGISVNFSRLQRLRPGYGYDTLEDKTINDSAPKDDGIFLVDLTNGKSELIVSLLDLAKNIKDYKKYQHYINHVSISPDGNNVMFFHLYTYEKYPGWRTQLYVYNISSKKLNLLEKDVLVSHYSWIDNNKMIITCCDVNNRNVSYRLYDIIENSFSELLDSSLNKDGHPTFINDDVFITDTYPDSNKYQQLFLYDIRKSKYKLVFNIFSNPRLNNEFRCDLHPKVCNKDVICIDTTFKSNKRSILLVELK